MKEIKDKIYDILDEDVTLRALTGWTLVDTRIYLEWPPEPIPLTVLLPAYLTLDFMDPAPMDMTTYVQPVQYPDEVVEINVWTNGDLLRDAIAERINVLFWQKKDTEIWTDNIRIMHVIQESQEDIQDIHEGTGQIIYWRKYIRLRMEEVYKL